VLRPKEVCAQLAVSASTLRAWSTEFKDYLSPAGQDALGRARASISSLQDQAERYEGRLEAEQAAHADTRRSLAEAQRKLAEAQQVNARLAEANAGLHAQVDQLEREVNAPVWQRVFR
jgi:chromosome segregation ATPase